MRPVAAMLLVLTACTDDAPDFSMIWEGLDTLAAELQATSTRCPGAAGFLLEGVSDSAGVLLMLSTDLAGRYAVGDSGAQAIISRVLPSRMEGWRADSGVIEIQPGALGLAGSYEVWLPDARVSGSFTRISGMPDSLACEVGDSSAGL